MPTKKTVQRARTRAKEGKAPTTQAGEFVKEEIKRYKCGAKDIKSRKQAVAIGLSEARRAGVKLDRPAPGKTSKATRRKADRDTEVGQGRAKPSPARSRGARKAAATRKKRG